MAITRQPKPDLDNLSLAQKKMNSDEVECQALLLNAMQTRNLSSALAVGDALEAEIQRLQRENVMALLRLDEHLTRLHSQLLALSRSARSVAGLLK